MSQEQAFKPATNLEQRIAIVTGGGSGIGLAIAQKFVHAGIRTIIIGRDEEKLLATQKRLGPLCHAVSQDLNDLDAIPALISRIIKEHGHIDILVKTPVSI